MAESRARRRAPDIPGAVAAVIAVAASAATLLFVLLAGDAFAAIAADVSIYLAFLAVAVGLQFVSFEVYGRGSVSFAGTGLLALGFAFGPGAAIPVALLIAVGRLLQRHGAAYRALFDASILALACGSARGPSGRWPA